MFSRFVTGAHNYEKQVHLHINWGRGAADSVCVCEPGGGSGDSRRKWHSFIAAVLLDTHPFLYFGGGGG